MTAVRKHHHHLTPDEVIREISREVSQIAGIQLGEKQKTMVESRLKNRMLELKIQSFEDYYTFFKNHEASEIQSLVSLLTTHHTYFFREFSHFEYIEFKLIKSLIEVARQRPDKKIKIWSAACSRGQEVYSLGMFFDEVLKRVAPDVSFAIYGSDIDPESVSIAKNAVYPYESIKSIPMKYLSNHWVKGTGDIADFAKVKKSISDRCQFGVVNLFDIKGLPTDKFDLVFCRNVFIYFTQDQIKQITQNLMKYTQSTGYLFIGISESLHGLGLSVENKGPSIYSHKIEKTQSPQKPSTVPTEAAKFPTKSPTVSVPQQQPDEFILNIPEKLKVLCVDDSPTIITLMKKILTAEFGFEVVATAGNGFEAQEAMKKHKIDLITLDIHMPEMTGIEYLQKNFKKDHPPVVMVTSVSRENSDLAIQALELGASDFIEKPSLQVLTERADEIRMKLRCAFTNKLLNESKKDLSIDKEFSKLPVIKNADKKALVIYFSLSDRERVISTLKELQAKNHPPTYLIIEGSEGALEEISKKMSFQSGKKVDYFDKFNGSHKTDSYILLDFKKNFVDLKKYWHGKGSSVLVFGDPSKGTAQKLMDWQNAQLLVEDRGQGTKTPFAHRATDIVPSTSFAYMTTDYLGKLP